MAGQQLLGGRRSRRRTDAASYGAGFISGDERESGAGRGRLRLVRLFLGSFSDGYQS